MRCSHADTSLWTCSFPFLGPGLPGAREQAQEDLPVHRAHGAGKPLVGSHECAPPNLTHLHTIKMPTPATSRDSGSGPVTPGVHGKADGHHGLWISTMVLVIPG